MSERPRRIGVIGATGALGSEVLAVLSASPLRVGEVVPLASERSLGTDVEFRDGVYAVASERASLRGLDLLFACAPPAACLEWVRRALREEVPCIDLSGALAGQPEVPVGVAWLSEPAEPAAAPVLAPPPGPALAWALVLRPLAARAGLERVVGTLLDGASRGGRSGIDALSAESVALFNQQDLPEPEVFARPVAFDLLPGVGAVDAEGRTEREAELVRGVARLLGPEPRVAATSVQVPIFVGHASALAVETREPLDPKAATELLSQAPGLEVWEEGAPSTRASAGRDVVGVGRIRRDPSCERGLLLWLAADLLRLTATNAVRLAESRLVPR